mmetsp:Transcript_18528/g.27711  ORF Transcript_18528/g.27711 Transcript_18528/m.27711 type:complete len:225 (+) Transcript_18528:286-960(+)
MKTSSLFLTITSRHLPITNHHRPGLNSKTEFRVFCVALHQLLTAKMSHLRTMSLDHPCWMKVEMLVKTAKGRHPTQCQLIRLTPSVLLQRLDQRHRVKRKARASCSASLSILQRRTSLRRRNQVHLKLLPNNLRVNKLRKQRCGSQHLIKKPGGRIITTVRRNRLYGKSQLDTMKRAKSWQGRKRKALLIYGKLRLIHRLGKLIITTKRRRRSLGQYRRDTREA